MDPPCFISNKKGSSPISFGNDCVTFLTITINPLALSSLPVCRSLGEGSPQVFGATVTGLPTGKRYCFRVVVVENVGNNNQRTLYGQVRYACIGGEVRCLCLGVRLMRSELSTLIAQPRVRPLPYIKDDDDNRWSKPVSFDCDGVLPFHSPTMVIATHLNLSYVYMSL